MLGDSSGALEAYRKAIEADPKDWQSYVERATIYNVGKLYDQVVSDCSKAIELNANAMQAYPMRGYAFLCQGKFAEALADCDKALAADAQQAMPFLVRAGY